ncbi:ATP-binding cassette domain-containing protein [Enterococcus xiangfangensis]|uniref:ATP-binding cassette domain-containing protein n=1 Tax=Enterococcus xiangfangensis TaxID=1296537 RepID=UPI0010F84978|nr:ATP-binding cassette domain-containing protein [Enterococcus xiangfangensis]MBM7712535.1 ABC-2 type transport system ATP-binding protein [Enterococcus xiangfangensis]NBK08875.1 ATP-binding cassette domain-containing protein [Enterococcus asini]
MQEIVLKTTNVTKKYQGIHALDNVSIAIKRGAIYGLIGENGAGKSTFMRAIMDLIAIDGGEIELFGRTDKKGLQQARRQMGQSIESPALYPELTAKENLQVQAANGGVGDSRISELLELLNLQTTGKKKVKNFSLGMRQRLAIAMALITNPEFLILDEPTNGLDPSGIVEIREIIQQLVTEKGITVLLSSHLLNELAEIATDYGILHKGRLIKEVTKEELQQESRQFIELETPVVQQALVVLDAQLITDYKVIDQKTIHIYQQNDQVAQLNQSLVSADIPVTRIGVTRQNLETYFLELTEGNEHDKLTSSR